MSCDDYFTCPKCKKFEALKVWYGDAIRDDLTIDITIPHGICSNCNFSFKGFSLREYDKNNKIQ